MAHHDAFRGSRDYRALHVRNARPTRAIAIAAIDIPDGAVRWTGLELIVVCPAPSARTGWLAVVGVHGSTKI